MFRERARRPSTTRRDISQWSVWGYLPALLCLAFVWRQGIVLAQPSESTLRLKTGKDIFRAACIGCHGPEGKGMPQTTIGFTPPATFPDFTDCKSTTREPNRDWKSIIHLGGPARGFSEIMPSFTEALTPDQIERAVEYLRSFCREGSWPRGELNLPRALITDKAYPEDEAVMTTAVNATGAAGITNTVVYERRMGAKNQLELAIPFAVQRQDTRTWFGGVGDLTLGYKRNLFSSLRSGSIVSLSGEVNLPTGSKERGLGSGVTVFETFATYGQILPKNTFVQFQGGAELPTHTVDAPKAVFWRTVLGKSFTQGMGFGRLWSPMVEALADRELQAGAKTNWDLLPQIQVTLSKRQHVRADFGVRFPLNNTRGRATQALFYLLWDWFDGGLRDGWR
ncbi:MAG TPA: cytochrome c [Bryobacteraceae bacterium]|nr:cytochrome c [Bryobacteraceae bacterium]